MKTLLLMRHGKSSWKEKDLPDHERPLKKRGRKTVSQMGEFILEKELVPELILSSTAERARQTAERFIEACKFKGKVEFHDRLYMAEQDAILEVIAACGGELERVMVIGHNPGMEGLVQTLGGKIKSMPTASIACFSIPIENWSDLKADQEAELVEIWKPSEVD